MSRREACWAGGTSRSNIRAAVATVQPWRISDIRTTMNATPKNIAASGSPATTGMIARKIGTAPRRPTHEKMQPSLPSWPIRSRFAPDFPLEGSGFEPLVPRHKIPFRCEVR